MDLCHEVMLLLFNTPSRSVAAFLPGQGCPSAAPPGHQPCVRASLFLRVYLSSMNPSSILGSWFEPTGSKVLCGERQLIHTCWDLGNCVSSLPGSWLPGKGFWLRGRGSRAVTVRAALGQEVPALAVPPRRPSSLPLSPAAPRASCPRGLQLLRDWL